VLGHRADASPTLERGSSRGGAVVSDDGGVQDTEPGTAQDVTGPAAEPPSPPRRGRGNRTIGDMIRSLAVVAGVVVVLILIVPRPSAVSQPPVDVPGTAQGAKASAHFTLDLPSGLSEEWRATSVRLLNSADGIQTWHVGYETPAAQYAAMEQAKDVTDAWIKSNSNGGTVVGSQQVNGVTWVRLEHDNRLQRSLLLNQGDITILVTGTADWPELGELAASLRPLS
jgi:hypothetical protein